MTDADNAIEHSSRSTALNIKIYHFLCTICFVCSLCHCSLHSILTYKYIPMMSFDDEYIGFVLVIKLAQCSTTLELSYL